MAWTAPSTWVAGAVLTAAQLNQQLRDNFKAIGDPWTSYTPAWAGTTDPVIGNGTLTGAYMSAGKLTHVSISIIMGSTTTYGSGTWSLSLPNTLVGTMRFPFTGIARDTSAGQFYPLRTAGSVAPLGLMCDGTTAGGPLRSVTPTIPFTFANTDELHLFGTYETA